MQAYIYNMHIEGDDQVHLVFAEDINKAVNKLKEYLRTQRDIALSKDNKYWLLDNITDEDIEKVSTDLLTELDTNKICSVFSGSCDGYGVLQIFQGHEQ
jgi:hypothetical protein